jgi:hypothetical protein
MPTTAETKHQDDDDLAALRDELDRFRARLRADDARLQERLDRLYAGERTDA